MVRDEAGRAKAKEVSAAGSSHRTCALAVAKTMGSSEFTTWVALAGAAIVAGLTAIYSSSPWVLITQHF